MELVKTAVLPIDQEVDALPCQNVTKAYIKGIYKDFIRAEKVPNHSSITILYAEAKFSYDFEKFRSLADWLFYLKTLYPEHLNAASPDYYDAVAQNSYYRCYVIVNRQWKVFEELADQFEEISQAMSSRLTLSKRL